MIRYSFAFILLVALGSTGAACAGEPPAATASPVAPGQSPRAHDAGVMKGTITAVDYQRGVITLAGRGGRIDVFVVPSTNIQGPGSGYHAINDLVKGSKVQIWASQIGDRYIAQIIRLK